MMRLCVMRYDLNVFMIKEFMVEEIDHAYLGFHWGFFEERVMGIKRR
jgi:hypothetical protein